MFWCFFCFCTNITHHIISVSSCIYNKFFKYMCYTRDHLLSNLNYVFPCNIPNGCLFLLSMTCHHGITMYSTQKKILVFGIHIIHRWTCFFSAITTPNSNMFLFFLSSCPLIHEQLICNIENIFNNYGKRGISFSILSAVYSMRPSFMLVGQ